MQSPGDSKTDAHACIILPNLMVVEIILLKSSTNNTIRNFKTVMFLSPFGYLYDRHRMFFSYTFI